MTVERKQCGDCGLYFDATPENFGEYTKRDRPGVYLKSMCRGCQAIRSRLRHLHRKNLKVQVLRKACRLCGEEKDAAEFYRSNHTATLLRNECRACLNRFVVERRQECRRNG